MSSIVLCSSGSSRAHRASVISARPANDTLVTKSPTLQVCSAAEPPTGDRNRQPDLTGPPLSTRPRCRRGRDQRHLILREHRLSSLRFTPPPVNCLARTFGNPYALTIDRRLTAKAGWPPRPKSRRPSAPDRNLVQVPATGSFRTRSGAAQPRRRIPPDGPHSYRPRRRC